MKLNQTQEEMIREFAKSNKFSQAKLLDLGAQLLGTVKKSTGNPLILRHWKSVNV